MVPSESDLRNALRGDRPDAATGIDTDVVVRRIRARRVPKQVAFSTLTVLAVAGVVVLSVTTLPSLHRDGAATTDAVTSMQAPSAGDAAESSPEKVADPQTLPSSRCGQPTSAAPHSAVPHSAPLELSIEFPESAHADGTPVAGQVVLTNSGTTRVTGTTALEPVITVARAGITVWHSNPVLTSQAVLIDLAPGESYFYEAQVTPVECEAADDEDAQFRDGLLPLAPGRYELSAEIVFYPQGAEPSDGVIVGGPVAHIELR